MVVFTRRSYGVARAPYVFAVLYAVLCAIGNDLDNDFSFKLFSYVALSLFLLALQRGGPRAHTAFGTVSMTATTTTNQNKKKKKSGRYSTLLLFVCMCECELVLFRLVIFYIGKRKRA